MKKAKQYSGDGEEIMISIVEERLYINNGNRGRIIDILVTVYSTGEIIYKTPRNFIDIHLYNYLYEFTFVLSNDEEIRVFSKYNSKKFKEILGCKKEKKRYTLEFQQDVELPVVLIEDKGTRVLLKRLAIKHASRYITKNFSRVTFHKIPSYQNGKVESYDYPLYIFHKFVIQSGINVYINVFILMFVICVCVPFYVVDFNNLIESLWVIGILIFFALLFCSIPIFLLKKLENHLLKNFFNNKD
ncbi:MAG: hypothetical protein ACRC0V_10900 [Fusobacteriaceae bacterium]